jgi:hypothetical protein
VSEEVRQVEPEDDELSECWQRMPDSEIYLRGVEAVTGEEIDGWQVTLGAGEYFRTEPMGVELEQRIANALRAVPGVSAVERIRWETWEVNGTPSGQALVHAAAAVLDELTDRMRAAYDEMF